MTVNVNKEQDKNKKMCSTNLEGVGHHSPPKKKNEPKIIEVEEKVNAKVFLRMSAINSLVAT